MKHILPIGLLARCSLTIFSCVKEVTHPVSPYLVNHCSYQPGTYWVYADSSTGNVDSLVVTSPPHLTTESERRDNVLTKTEILSTSLALYINGILYTGYYTAPHITITQGVLTLNCVIAKDTSWHQSDATIFYPYATTLPSAEVNGTTYLKVHTNSTCLFTEDAGFIKIGFWDAHGHITNKVWQLQRYNVVR